MRKLLLLLMLIPFAANAKNVMYYSTTCPHCHNAMAFFDAEKTDIERINVAEGDNVELFRAAVKKCELQSGGVPLIVIRDKCFQGYAEFMNDDIRSAIANAPVEAQKKTDDGSPIYFYIGLALVVLGAGLLLFKKKK